MADVNNNGNNAGRRRGKFSGGGGGGRSVLLFAALITLLLSICNPASASRPPQPSSPSFHQSYRNHDWPQPRPQPSSPFLPVPNGERDASSQPPPPPPQLDPELYARIFRPYHSFGRQLYINDYRMKGSNRGGQKKASGRRVVEDLFRHLLRGDKVDLDHVGGGDDEMTWLGQGPLDEIGTEEDFLSRQREGTRSWGRQRRRSRRRSD